MARHLIPQLGDLGLVRATTARMRQWYAARMLVLLATWSGLRWGELVALRRGSLDLDQGRLTVVDQLVDTQHERHLGPHKTDAGRRTVYLPPHLVIADALGVSRQAAGQRYQSRG